MRAPGPALLLSILLLPVAGCGSEDDGVAEPAAPARIVLITLDTLRWDAFAGNGERPSAMPLTTAWAQDAAVFERYHSATSSTQPTHASLFTGLHPWQHGVPLNGAVLAEEHTTLAERLRERGFATAAVVASLPLHRQFGFQQGFEVYHDVFDRGHAKSWEGVDVEAEGFSAGAKEVLARAVELLDDAVSTRQFFWFHFYDPHSPYGDADGDGAIKMRHIRERLEAGEPPGETFAWAREAYDRDVAHLDAALGRLLARLGQDSDRLPTHVVLVSDHGESFGEDGSLGHGKRLTPGQIQVPLVIRSPDLPAGRHRGDVGTLDVTATLLHLAGIDEHPPGSIVLGGEPRAHVVLGMRRTFNTSVEERRTDGTRVVFGPEDLGFFVVEEGVVYTGDGTQVLVDDDGLPLDEAASARHRSLFARLQEDFVDSYRVVEDDATVEALRAMGYTGQ